MSDLFRLDNQVVAVIGAGSGIGEAVAMGAASQGAAVVWCLDLNEAGAARVAQAIERAGGGAGRPRSISATRWRP